MTKKQLILNGLLSEEKAREMAFDLLKYLNLGPAQLKKALLWAQDNGALLKATFIITEYIENENDYDKTFVDLEGFWSYQGGGWSNIEQKFRKY